MAAGRKRWIEVDMLKGLAALLTLYGHLVLMYIGSTRFEAKWIFCFHMPAFFFCAGFITDESSMDRPFLPWFWRRFRKLIGFEILFRAFMCLINLYNTGALGDTGKVISQLSQYLTHYSAEWFGPTMIVALEGLYLFRVIERKVGKIAFLLPAFLLAFTPYFCRFYAENELRRYNTFVAWDAVMLGFAFLWLGYFARQVVLPGIRAWADRTRGGVTAKMQKSFLRGMGAISMLFIMCYLARPSYGYVNYASAQLGDSEFAAFFCALGMISFWLGCFYLLRRVRAMAWLTRYLSFCGRHSMQFYLLHIALNQVFVILYLEFTGRAYYQWEVSYGFRVVYALCMTLFISLLFRAVSGLGGGIKKALGRRTAIDRGCGSTRRNETIGGNP